MKKLFISMLWVTTITTALTGCMTTPTPEYVSANNYQSYDCTQLANEYTRVNQYIDANANQRTGLSASGIGIGVAGGRGGIYPTVSIGLGSVTGGNRHNLSIAMGQRDAMVQAARLKQCGFANGIKLYSER